MNYKKILFYLQICFLIFLFETSLVYVIREKEIMYMKGFKEGISSKYSSICELLVNQSNYWRYEGNSCSFGSGIYRMNVSCPYGDFFVYSSKPKSKILDIVSNIKTGCDIK